MKKCLLCSISGLIYFCLHLIVADTLVLVANGFCAFVFVCISAVRCCIAFTTPFDSLFFPYLLAWIFSCHYSVDRLSTKCHCVCDEVKVKKSLDHHHHNNCSVLRFVFFLLFLVKNISFEQNNKTLEGISIIQWYFSQCWNKHFSAYTRLNICVLLLEKKDITFWLLYIYYFFANFNESYTNVAPKRNFHCSVFQSSMKCSIRDFQRLFFISSFIIFIHCCWFFFLICSSLTDMPKILIDFDKMIIAYTQFHKTVHNNFKITISKCVRRERDTVRKREKKYTQTALALLIISIIALNKNETTSCFVWCKSCHSWR